MYRCFIVDDESHAIETLLEYCVKSGQLHVAGTSQNPLDAIKYINENKDVDITFLDIDMPELSGLEVADLIFENTAIIFTTAHPNYAVQGFEKNVSDFLLKPISFERFLRAITKVIAGINIKNQKIKKGTDYFFINPGIKGKLTKINYEDVTHVEGLSNYVLIHTGKQTHIVYLTMKEIEMSLPPDTFVRIHKSYILNINKVTELDGNKVLIDHINLPIGASYKGRLLHLVNAKLIRSHRI
jgi:DNA-binding LytR/AlgR family response regulator